MVATKMLRKITAGKLSWIAGVLPRLRWVVNMFYATLTAADREEKEGIERMRASKRQDTREKRGFVAAKRLQPGIHG